MKKIISFILSISLLSSIICIPVSATEDVVASESIEEFCEDVNEMVTEYSDSEFVTPEFIGEEQATEYTSEEIEINYCSRLIVQSDKPIDTYNAVDVVSGFSNFYIVQFENEEDTNYAYKQYKNDSSVLSVEYDISYDAVTLTTEDVVENPDLTYEDYKNAWYLNATGIDCVLKEYQTVNMPEIVVAVIDTGIDLNCKYLQDRIVRTYFNSSCDNANDSEQDYSEDSHGTMVSSVIANCTTDNVKIANYRCINSEGVIVSVASVTSAILEAVTRGASVINCSFKYAKSFYLVQEAIDYAYANSCIIVSAAGNMLGNLEIINGMPLNISEHVITVGSSNRFNAPSGFTAYGKPIDVLAPGEDVEVVGSNNEILQVSGTSFSSPIVTSIYAMLSVIQNKMSFNNRVRVVKNCGTGTSEKYVNNLFGSGIANALTVFEMDKIQAPIFSHNSGTYVGPLSLEIQVNDDVSVYYTTDQTYPSPTNGTLYTNPITLKDEYTTVCAVAYQNGKRSNFVSVDICSALLGTDDMFSITTDGVVTDYIGNIKYLKIPEKINGVEIKDFQARVFDGIEIYGIILPDTIEYLGTTFDLYENRVLGDEASPFLGNETIEYIYGKNVRVLGNKACANLYNLVEVDFPNCEIIHSRAFYWSTIIGAYFPKAKLVGKEAFWRTTNLREVYLPLCEKIGYRAFEDSVSLNYIYAPKANYLDSNEFDDGILKEDDIDTTANMFYECSELTHINLPAMETIGEKAFYLSAIKRIELSSVKNIYDLPTTLSNYDVDSITYGTYYSPYYLPISIELSLPNTLEYCVPATTYKNEFIKYVVYGTADVNSYAEQWAKENDIEFINISQETAIVEDIETIWDKYSYKPLEFDARGFNRTYQWYGSKDKIQGNYDDKPITNATDKTFNPDDYKSYPYYYCVMTSTDKDIEGEIVNQINIKSSMCQNRLYYMFALPNTHIDFDNNLIYTKTTGCKDFFNIIEIQENTSYSSLPSLVYKEHNWYGTGSEFVIYNGTKKERYSLIVEGDVDGDSAVDVIDASVVALVANNLATLEDEYFLAADINLDQEITIEDYAQVVNLVLSN